jgi:hypothetical protein
MPHGGKRAIVRCRDDEYLHPVPPLNLDGARGLHLDGHQPDAAIHYAKIFREGGVLTSLDGGGLRQNTHDLLGFIDVAVVAERLCEQMNLDAAGMLDYLQSRGCKIGGITQGADGMVWYDETGERRHLPSLSVPPAARGRHERRRRHLPRRLHVFRDGAARSSRGSTISPLRGPPRRMRSSISATRPASRVCATSTSPTETWPERRPRAVAAE